MQRAPDYVAPLEGWRLWEVVGGRGGARLRSLVRRDCRWPVGAALQADCPSGRLAGFPSPHPAPEAGCWCGIHAFLDEDLALRTMVDLGSELDGPVVVGVVRLWGRVVECTAGLRGQYGYPGELWIPYVASRPRAAVVAERVAAALEPYGVPVRPLPLDGWSCPPPSLPRSGAHPRPEEVS